MPGKIFGGLFRLTACGDSYRKVLRFIVDEGTWVKMQK